MFSNLISNNEEILKNAINSGISSDTVSMTISEFIEKKDISGKTYKQLPKALSSIIYMKRMVKEKDTEEYYSSVVKNNSERIKSALRDGISPDEIAMSLIDMVYSPSKNAKKRLNFMVKLITKMKKKELKLQKQNEIKGYQKVYSNN